MAEQKKRGRKPSPATQQARKMDERNENKEYSIPSGAVHVCTCCGKHATKSSLEKLFYMSYSPFYAKAGRVPLCKDCMVAMSTYNGQLKVSMFSEVLRIIDKPYLESEFESSINQIINELDKNGEANAREFVLKNKISQLIGIYIKNITLNNKDFTWLDGNTNIVGTFTSNTLNPDDYEEVDLEALRRRWGRDLPTEDIVLLQEKYDIWESRYELEGNRNKELCVEQIVYEELFILKERQQPNKDVSKRLTTIQNLMKTANLSPKQESASESAEFETLGQFIKKVEQHKPIINKNPEYKDVDGFEKMWKSLAGAIKRTVGRPDDDTVVFEDTYKEETMDLTNLSGGDD